MNRMSAWLRDPLVMVAFVLGLLVLLTAGCVSVDRMEAAVARLSDEIKTSTKQSVQATNTVGGNLAQKITTESTTTTGVTGATLVGLAAILTAGGVAGLYFRALIKKHGYCQKTQANKKRTLGKVFAQWSGRVPQKPETPTKPPSNEP